MAILYLNKFDKEILIHLDNFSEYSYVENICQHGFIFLKNNRKLYVYLNCKTGIHSAHLMVDNEAVMNLIYHKSDCIMVYNQSIYFEHERIRDYQKEIGIDTEKMEINISLLDNLSFARNDWLDASPKTIESQRFRILKDGIRCTSEANRGDEIFYRCLFCETMISSVPTDSVSCKCGSLHIDIGMFKFYVQNLAKIQVLERTKK